MPPRRSKSKSTVGVKGIKRGSKKRGESNGNGTSNRTTIFLPEVLDQNLNCLSLQKGESRTTIVRLALAEYMIKFGYDPYKRPRVSISHP